MKKINEVFSDYKSEGSINTAIVEKIKLKKKSKILEIEVSSDKYIEINEIEGLNNFIKERFLLNESRIIINYSEEVHISPIENEMDNILYTLSNRHPYLKAVINNCDYEIKENEINFCFNMSVSHMLKNLKYDSEIQKAIKDIYGKNYRINFCDNVSSEEQNKLNEDKKKEEMIRFQKEIKVSSGSFETSGNSSKEKNLNQIKIQMGRVHLTKVFIKLMEENQKVREKAIRKIIHFLFLVEVAI